LIEPVKAKAADARRKRILFMENVPAVLFRTIHFRFYFIECIPIVFPDTIQINIKNNQLKSLSNGAALDGDS
jgi:hypothetical protein